MRGGCLALPIGVVGVERVGRYPGDGFKELVEDGACQIHGPGLKERSADLKCDEVALRA
jgi:hypothetical protein